MPLAALAALAALPIVAILVFMLLVRWPAARAGVTGFVVALVLALTVFGLGTRSYEALGPAGASAGALLEAGFTAITILWILLPALCIYGLQVSTGSIDVIRMAMGRLSHDPRMVALLVAWFFALFLEGAAGFGTPIALAAPFLVSAGFKPVEAVTVALLGHAIGVSFGAVGTPTLPQVAATGSSGLQVAAATGLYHSLLGWVMMVFLVRFVNKKGRAGAAILPWAGLAALLFLLPHFLLSRFVGPELPTLGGAFFGGLLFAGFLLLRQRQQAQEQSGGTAKVPRASLPKAAAPYLILVTLILLSRLVPPLQDALRSVTLAWSWQGFSGSVQLLYHPGTMLMLSFLLGALWQGAGLKKVGAALGGAARGLLPVTIALLAMLALSRIMVHSSMIGTLAEAAATAGGLWPVLAPFVGVLGTFVTGSATASNILFSDFQVATAAGLELPVLTLVGAQGFGAAVGNIICPHNIIAGGATVGVAGKEGEILKNTLLPCLLYSLSGGLLAFALVRLTF